MVYLNIRQAVTNNITVNVDQCANLTMSILTTPVTTPPYFLIAYDTRSSIPTVLPLTVENRFVSWTVVYPALRTIVYNLVDSEGKPIRNPLEVKVQNGSTECLPPPSNRTTPLTVTSNVLRDLDPCSPLNTRIDGGQKPYTVSLVPIQVAPVINITLGPNDDSLYWVNVLLPNTGLIVSVSDSQGQYGGIERFTTSGSNNGTSCPRQITGTHSFNSRDPFSQKINATNSQNDGGRTTAIVGGTMGAVILLGLLFILYRHRKRHREDRRETGFGGSNERIAGYIPVPINQTSFPSTYFDPSYNVQPTSSSGNIGVAGAGMNVSSQKAAREAAREAARAAQEGGVSAPTAMQHTSGLQVPQSSGVQVRQHTDAMAIIELPPAYRDATPQ